MYCFQLSQDADLYFEVEAKQLVDVKNTHYTHTKIKRYETQETYPYLELETRARREPLSISASLSKLRHMPFIPSTLSRERERERGGSGSGSDK